MSLAEAGSADILNRIWNCQSFRRRWPRLINFVSPEDPSSSEVLGQMQEVLNFPFKVKSISSIFICLISIFDCENKLTIRASICEGPGDVLAIYAKFDESHALSLKNITSFITGISMGLPKDTFPLLKATISAEEGRLSILFGFNSTDSTISVVSSTVSRDPCSSIAFSICADLPSQFQKLTHSIALSFIFKPSLSFNLCSGSEALLMRISSLYPCEYDAGVRFRVKELCNYLFPNCQAYLFTHQCKDQSVDGEVNTILAYVPTNTESELCFFPFERGNPRFELLNSFTHSILSCVEWSKHNITIIPNGIDDPISLRGREFCARSRILRPKGASILLFLSTAQTNTLTLCKEAIDNVLDEFQKQCPNFFYKNRIKKSYNCLWSAIPSLSSSISHILEDPDGNIFKSIMSCASSILISAS